GHVGVQSQPGWAQVRQNRPVRPDVTDVLGVRVAGWPETAVGSGMDVPVRGGPRPGPQRGGQRVGPGTLGQLKRLWSAGKTGSNPGTAPRSRNPPRRRAVRAQRGGNPRPLRAGRTSRVGPTHRLSV